MHAMKNAAATVKEKVSNVGAKGELKKDEARISAEEKRDKAMAHTDAEEQQVKAEKHMKQADAIRAKEGKKMEHEAEKEAAKDTLAHRKAAAAHAYDHPTNIPPPPGPTM